MLVDKDVVSQRVYISAVLKNIKDFLTGLVNQATDKTLSVRVENQETKLYKEIAENTRGVKGKLQTLNDTLTAKKVDLSKVESKLDEIAKKDLSVKIGETKVIVDNVKVTNLSDIKIPELVIPKEVKVSNLADIKLPQPIKPEKVDFSSLEERVKALKSALDKIFDYLPTLKPQVFPKIEIPKQFSVKEATKIIEAVEKGTETLSDDLLALSKVIKNNSGGVSDGLEVKVTNFPPTHIPTPVTNFNINSLRGVPKSTLVTVGTTATPLPATPLEQRRSMLLFNDSGSVIYLGGADVTVNNGLPVLDQSYSPPIDAGQHMVIYGIASTTGCEVRVFEVSNDSEGN